MTGFEVIARQRKVAALLALVPASRTEREHEAVADTLAGFSPADRVRFAAHAGVRAPSEETWRQLVEAVRARKAVA